MTDEQLLEMARACPQPNPRNRRTRASQAQKEAVWRRAGGLCEGCGSTKNLRIHHKIPSSKGGTNRLSNLVLMCECCEQRDHARYGL